MTLFRLPSRLPRVIVPAALGACVLLFAVAGSPAQRLSAASETRAAARQQFAEAVRLRTMLEGYLEKDRSPDDYKQTIAAYHKVYLIDPLADEVSSALMAEGELYEEMGRAYGERYFQSAATSYQFLVKQYGNTRFRGPALYETGRIEKDRLGQMDEAQAAFEEYLNDFPDGEKSAAARIALKQIAEQRAEEAKVLAGWQAQAQAQPVAEGEPVVEGPLAEPQEAASGTPYVRAIRTWNSPDAARIVITLGDTVRYKSALIESPERIYFDLSRARISPAFARRPIDVDPGLLKSVRLAQNRPGTVRVVLDVSGAKKYSEFLVSHPYRLVIDVHAHAANAAPQASPSASAERVPQAPDSGATHEGRRQAAAVSLAAAGKPAAGFTAAPARSGEAAPSADAGPDSGSSPFLADVYPRLEDAGPAPTPADEAARGKAAEARGPAAARKARAKLMAGAAAPALVAPKPTRDGTRSLTRALGLKVSRIVVDPGHGGRDTGTVGPHGLMEKDLCLDVAQRLGRLIERNLPGAEVVYTRTDDRFIALEQRTAIANAAKADLFISIHANASRSASARGVETYYLSLTNNADALEVAARENATSQTAQHDLPDLIKAIERNDKIEESRELASDIQDALSARLELVSRSERNRGVKKAPFMVLIGANMPSVLAEISFVSNPADERLLRRPTQRQRIALGLYRGIAAYLASLNSLSYDKKPAATSAVASNPASSAAASNSGPSNPDPQR